MKRLAILVIGLGFVIRLFCFHYTAVINPDGAIYIHQARAIYYGLYDSLTTCGMHYVSSYPIFIAGAYVIFSNWVIAAKSVSLFFGTMTLVPLYFLLKRFFDESIGLLVLLIFALIPVLVDRSVDVVKGPVFWFFAAYGLYLFVRQIDNKNNLYLLLSSVSFLMATWARVEGILFVVVSCVYILLVKQDRKFEKLLIFTMPVFVIMFFAISGMIINVSSLHIFRQQEIIDFLSSPFAGYEYLRVGLESLKDYAQGPVQPFYIDWVRHLVWFVALGILLVNLVEALFYPFFLLFIIGLFGIWERLKKDRLTLYFAFLGIGALIVLYMYILRSQTMSTRFLVLFLLPSSIFIGFGVEKITLFFRSRFHLRESLVLSILCLLILACALPKNLKPREVDKLTFKEIGELIAEREGNDKEILVATSQYSIRWISLYSNLDYKGAPCPWKNFDLDNILGKNYEEFVRNLKDREIHYFLWEEKHWPKQSASYITTQNPKDFIRVGTWSHPDTGKLILFEMI